MPLMLEDLMEEKPTKPGRVLPSTRRWIITALTLVALACIAGEVVMALAGKPTSDAMLTVAATAVGGVAGLAVPGKDDQR